MPIGGVLSSYAKKCSKVSDIRAKKCIFAAKVLKNNA